jgi:biopolymer transport protein ExbD
VKLRPKHELPIVPTANLVDIAILLIIFYMACSNFLSHSAGRIVPPRAAGLAVQKEPLTVVTVDREGAIQLQGRPVANAAALGDALSGLLRDKTTEEERSVMFKCDASVGREIFAPLIEAIAEAGGVILAVGEPAAAAR